MGSLTGYLQDAFAEHCPRGWTCHREAPLVGIAAFQVDLLPQLNAATIKRLNSGAIARAAGIDARAEIERVLQVSDADIVDGSHRIHKADNPFSVAVNVRQWNTEILHPPSA